MLQRALLAVSSSSFQESLFLGYCFSMRSNLAQLLLRPRRGLVSHHEAARPTLLRHSGTKAAGPNLLRLNRLPPTGTMTKVVCTIGPATDCANNVHELVKEGMHVARLNFSHAGTDYSYPEECLALVRDAQGKHFHLSTDRKTNNLRSILVDTKGPEIRTGPLEANQDVVEIGVGEEVELTIHDVSGGQPVSGKHRINVDYKSIAHSMSVGGHVLLDDGLLALEVTGIDPKQEFVSCVALNGGPIKKNKGVNLPGVELDLPALTEKDKADLAWACKVGADYVAASFIRTAANVRSVVAYLDRCISTMPTNEDGKLPLRPLVISKIESKEGVDNFGEILKESDGIMVARGDLGVEMMVSACNATGKPVIVATQMLDSMMRNPRPTRAEVTDVGTAVWDGADAVMLSGETAAGKYPIESLKAMASVVWEADQILNTKSDLVWNQELHDSMTPEEQELDAVAASACKSAMRMQANMIILITMTGRVARAVARHRPAVPVLAFCVDPQVARRLQLHRSITPILLQTTLDPASSQTRMGLLRAEAVRTAKELGFSSSGDRIIMVDRTVGKTHDLHEYAHNMKVVTLI